MIRCRTPDGSHPLRGPATAATRIDIGSGTETESEGENLETVARPHSLLAVNMRGEGGDTGWMLAMHDPGGMFHFWRTSTMQNLELTKLVMHINAFKLKYSTCKLQTKLLSHSLGPK